MWASLLLFLAPFLPWMAPILFGAGSLLAVGANFFFGITDWFTLGVLVLTLAAFLVLFEQGSPWAKAALFAVIVVCSYIAGQMNGFDREKALHEKERAAIIARFEKAADDERARQKAVQDKMRADAAAEKKDRETLILELRAEVVKVREEAAADENAKRQCLSVDAVKRINRVRQGTAATSGSGGRKTKP